MKYVPDKLWSTLTVWGAREEGGEVIRTLDTLLICSKSTWIQIFSSHWDPVLKRIQQQIFFFCFLSPLRFSVFITLLYSIYSAICRPSDCTLGRPQAKKWTPDGQSRGRGHWPQDPHLSLIHVFSSVIFLLFFFT